jgi:hypothetical protein
MVGLISGCGKSSTTEAAPALDSFLNVSYASAIVDTVVRPILVSHAPLILVPQRAILAPRVLGEMPPRKSRPSMWVRQRPSVRWLLGSNLQRSMVSSKASKYRHSDMYKGAISHFEMRNLETSSAASVALVRAATPMNLYGSAAELILGPCWISRNCWWSVVIAGSK